MIEKVIKLRNEARQNGEPVLRDKSFELLLSLIKENKPKSILEVGTNVGLSGLAMLLTEKEAKLTGIEIDEEKVKLAKKNYEEFGVNNRAKIFLGDASEVIPMLNGKYDFIFLDGPKGHYFEYSENLLAILNVGGILFADNVLFHGMVRGYAPHRHSTIKHSMERFLDRITNDENLETTLYEIEDGVSVTKRIK